MGSSQLRWPGLDFAVTALFAVLSIEAYKEQKSLPLPALGLLCSIAAATLAPGNMLMVAMVLYVAALVASYTFERHRTPHA